MLNVILPSVPPLQLTFEILVVAVSIGGSFIKRESIVVHPLLVVLTVYRPAVKLKIESVV